MSLVMRRGVRCMFNESCRLKPQEFLPVIRRHGLIMKEP